MSTEAPATVPPVDKPTEKPAETVAPEKPVAEAVKAPAETQSANKTETTAADKPATKAPAATPIQQLWAAAQGAGHPEVWGVHLADPESHVPSQIVLQKYLNANDGNIDGAKDQLLKTLEWRAKTKPLELLNKDFSKEKFEGLGWVTSYSADKTDPEKNEVFTWNVYGIVKDIGKTFGVLDESVLSP
jgi:phosphatidylinositol transfer protein SFH5